MMTNKDKTGNERQQRRRHREKEWLKAKLVELKREQDSLEL